jgi:hypothetical protein
MFQFRSEKLKDLGFYQTITDTELIKDLKTRMGYLNMRSVAREWHPNHHFLITTALHGEQAQLLLTLLFKIPVSILYLVRSDKFLITHHRFHPNLYERNTVLFGDLHQNTLVIHAASFGEKNEKMVETLERLDGVLFNKFKEDTDLEPMCIAIKEFYEKDIDVQITSSHKALMYFSPLVRGQHYIKFK